MKKILIVAAAIAAFSLASVLAQAQMPTGTPTPEPSPTGTPPRYCCNNVKYGKFKYYCANNIATDVGEGIFVCQCTKKPNKTLCYTSTQVVPCLSSKGKPKILTSSDIITCP